MQLQKINQPKQNKTTTTKNQTTNQLYAYKLLFKCKWIRWLTEDEIYMYVLSPSLCFLSPLLWISSCRTVSFVFTVHYSPVTSGLMGVFCFSSVTASMFLNWKLRIFSMLVSVHICLIMPDWAAGHFAKRPKPTHFLLFFFWANTKSSMFTYFFISIMGEKNHPFFCHWHWKIWG